MEHRRAQRNGCRIPVTVYSRRSPPLQGDILDLSSGGAFIRLCDDAPWPRGVLRLSFVSPDPEARDCDLQGLVVRSSDEGIGVMFNRRHSETATPVRAPTYASVPLTPS